MSILEIRKQSPYYNAFVKYDKVEGFLPTWIVCAYREHSNGYEFSEEIIECSTEERAIKIANTYPAENPV